MCRCDLGIDKTAIEELQVLVVMNCICPHFCGYNLKQKHNFYHGSKTYSVKICKNKSMLRRQELLFSCLFVLKAFCSFPEASFQPTSRIVPHTFQFIPMPLYDSIIYYHEKSRLNMRSSHLIYVITNNNGPYTAS